MKTMLFLIVLIFQIAIVNGQQIVLLYGSGSAGKSTLSREILSLNPNLCHIDEDEVFNEMWLGHVSNLFPVEYKSITEVLPHENLFQAIKSSTIIFPEDSTCFQKESVKNAIEIIQNEITENDPEEFRKMIFQHFEMLIIDLVREKVNQNKSIILDRWYITPEMLRKVFPDTPVIKVLVFSTLERTLDNFNKRNERALQTKNSSSHRLYKNFIPSYTRLYKLSDDPMCSLCCYQRSELENIFKNIRDALLIEKTESKKAILFNDMTKEGLDRLKEAFIPTITCSDTLFLSPIDQYDIIIDTQILFSQKVALEEKIHFICSND
jgi:hypothetical protein